MFDNWFFDVFDYIDIAIYFEDKEGKTDKFSDNKILEKRGGYDNCKKSINKKYNKNEEKNNAKKYFLTEEEFFFLDALKMLGAEMIEYTVMPNGKTMWIAHGDSFEGRVYSEAYNRLKEFFRKSEEKISIGVLLEIDIDEDF